MDRNIIKPGQRWRYHYPRYPAPNPEDITLVEIICHDHDTVFRARTLFNGSYRYDPSGDILWDFHDSYEKNWELLVGQEAT